MQPSKDFIFPIRLKLFHRKLTKHDPYLSVLRGQCACIPHSNLLSLFNFYHFTSAREFNGDSRSPYRVYRLAIPNLRHHKPQLHPLIDTFSTYTIWKFIFFLPPTTLHTAPHLDWQPHGHTYPFVRAISAKMRLRARLDGLTAVSVDRDY